jgi:hypothetical protein
MYNGSVVISGDPNRDIMPRSPRAIDAETAKAEAIADLITGKSIYLNLTNPRIFKLLQSLLCIFPALINSGPNIRKIKGREVIALMVIIRRGADVKISILDLKARNIPTPSNIGGKIKIIFPENSITFVIQEYFL